MFADGEECIIRSGPDWRVRLEDEAAEQYGPVLSVGAYGGAEYGKAGIWDKTSLAPVWLRRTVTVEQGLERARLYVSPLGSGRPFINGEAAGDRLLSPAQSDYEDFAFYNIYDVTGLLEAGENALAVLLDGSWYHQVGGFNHVMSYGRPGLRSALVLEYDDGRTDWVLSDREWEWKEGELREANIYRGERVDYRQGHDEWRTPGAGAGWQAVQTLSPRSPVLQTTSS